MVQPYIGEIRMFGGSYAPLHWTFCAGTLMSITGNEALYSLLSNTYGGDGRSSFGLPDMRGRIPIHRGDGPGLTPRPRGEQYGTEEVTLDVTEIPLHNHPIQASTGAANSNYPNNRVLADPSTANPNVTLYQEPTDQAFVVEFSDDAVTKVGGGAAHSNLMPFLCVQFIIALQGDFPQRN